VITVGSARESDIWPDGCPYPPALRDEILRVARREVTSKDVDDSRLGFAAWYTPFHIAEQRVLARQQQAKDLQAQAVAELRQRVHRLEAMLLDEDAGYSDMLIETIARAISRKCKGSSARDRKAARRDPAV
jgi:hypothetical protein